MVAVKATKEDLNSWLDDDDDDESSDAKEKPQKTEVKKTPSKKTYAFWRVTIVVCLRQTTFLPSSESNCVFYCGSGIVGTQVVANINTACTSSNKHGSLKHIFLDSFPCLILLGILVLLLTNLQGLASLQRSLSLRLALLALQTQHQLLGLLGLHRHCPSLLLTFLWKIGLV